MAPAEIGAVSFLLPVIGGTGCAAFRASRAAATIAAREAQRMQDSLALLIDHWKADLHSTYNSWFLWEERLKNFRAIRRGIGQVVKDIEAGTFGNAYRGSSLETVVHSVAEQRQIFKGADHAFLWKPKLRIPDIYENPENQRAFGRLIGKSRGLGRRWRTFCISCIRPLCRPSTQKSSRATTA